MQRFMNTTQRNVAWFKQASDAHQLELRPSFQRNPVWTERQKSYLIDSIIHEYPIPELYMQETVDHKGKQRHIIVDGQQRIRACLEFIEGGFSINPEDSTDLPEATFDELSPEQKQRIYEYNFVVRVLPSMDETELRAIFKRLNRNVVALNAQELRHATYWGPFIMIVEELADEEYWERARIFSRNDVKRMIDAEFISELVVGMLHGPQNKKLSIEQYYITYESKFEKGSFVKSAFSAILSELDQVLPELDTTRWKKKSDFYTLFLVFANHLDALSLSSEKRKKAHTLLVKFGEDVSNLLEDIRKVKKYSKDVITYATNVERSATDIGNRKRRASSLESLLSEVW